MAQLLAQPSDKSIFEIEQKKIFKLNHNLILIKDYNLVKDRDSVLRKLTISRNIKDLNGEIIALSNLGYIYIRLGHLSRAYVVLMNGIERFDLVTSPTPIISVNSNLGLYYYIRGDFGKCIEYCKAAFRLAVAADDFKEQAICLRRIGGAYRELGNYAEAFDCFFNAHKVSEISTDTTQMSLSLNGLGTMYMLLRDYDNALKYHREALKLSLNLIDQTSLIFCYNGLGEVESLLNNTNTALKLFIKSKNVSRQIGDLINEAQAQTNIAEIYLKQKKYDAAKNLIKRTISIYLKLDNSSGLGKSQEILARTYLYKNQLDSALAFGKLSFENAANSKNLKLGRDASNTLSLIYRNLGRMNISYKYLDIYYNYHNKLLDESANRRVAFIESKLLFKEISDLRLKEKNEFIAKQERQEEKIHKQNLIISLIIISLVVCAIVFFVVKRSSNRTRKIQKISKELLIEKEKIASLSRLTAGIAHEIKNPLNFILGFSASTVELIEDYISEMKMTSINLLFSELEEIKDNLSIINKHSNKVTSVVNSMLRLYRSSPGIKQIVDITSLVADCVEIVKNSSTNYEDDYLNFTVDESVGKIFAIQQDLMIIIINLITNSLYAIKQKEALNIIDYIPKLNISIENNKEHVIIIVKDNGIGIPNDVKDKIYDPFFTTKQGTEGSGLGLTIVYESVNNLKGTIEVVSLEKEFTEFKISLPLTILSSSKK